ncbi:MAG: YhjD/YihY/BrkB family envelope integrity protein [Phycisphaeraceae bacterium]
MRLAKNIVESFGRLMTQPAVELTRKQKTVRYWTDLTRHCARELHYDKAGQMAAALTYHTLFSLMPMVVVMLVVLASFVSDTEREGFKSDIINWLLNPITKEQVTPSADIGQTPAGSEHTDTDNPQVLIDLEKEREFDEARAAIAASLQQAIDSLEKVSFKGIGTVGILIFIYGATGLLATIEKSFNLIYGVAKSRPWYLRLPLYWTAITLGPIAILGGQFAQKWFMDLIDKIPWTGWLVGPLVVLSPILTIWLALTLLYRWLPNTRVQLRAAVIGGFVASLIWVIAIQGLKWYFDGAAIRGIYGALALLPLFLLWLWVSWLIILFGLELAYAVQAMKGRRFKHLAQSQDLVIDGSWLIPLMRHIAQTFEQGKISQVDQLADAMNLPARVINRMLIALETANLIHHIGGDDERGGGYTLAKPADQINAAEVLQAGEQLTPTLRFLGEDPAWSIVQELHTQRQNFVEQTTMAQLAKAPKR